MTDDKNERSRRRTRNEPLPVRKKGEGNPWEGEPAQDAERQRGEGRGLDEPEKSADPDDLR